MKKISNYCVIDIETTGLSRYRDDIIEIGCIKVSHHKIIDYFDVLVDPHKAIPPFITSMTHITNEMIKQEGIELEDALIQLYDFIGEDDLIGHNIAFDMGFIRQKSMDCIGLSFDNICYDTLKIARRKINCDNYKLETLCQYYHVNNQQAHRALSDVMATYEVFEKLMNEEQI